MHDGQADPAAPPSRRGGRSDRIAAVVIFIVALFYIREAFSFRPFLRTEALGPATFPLVIGGMMLVLSIALFVNAFRGEIAEPAARRPLTQYAPPFVLWLLLLGYGLALRPAGYPAATGLFLFLSFLLLGVRQWWRALLYAAAFTAVSWYGFVALGVQLPVGDLFRP